MSCPIFKHILFYCRSSVLRNNFHPTRRPNFYWRYISFLSVLIQASILFLAVKEWGTGKELWRSLDERELTDVWKHIPQSGLGFVIHKGRRQQRGEEKNSGCQWYPRRKGSIWELLQGQKYNPIASMEVTTWCFLELFLLPIAFWQAGACCVCVLYIGQNKLNCVCVASCLCVARWSQKDKTRPKVSDEKEKDHSLLMEMCPNKFQEILQSQVGTAHVIGGWWVVFWTSHCHLMLFFCTLVAFFYFTYSNCLTHFSVQFRLYIMRERNYITTINVVYQRVSSKYKLCLYVHSRLLYNPTVFLV